MTDIGFYHLLTTPLERALPKLLERVLEKGGRAVVLAGSDERVEALSAALWTYDPNAFLPHGDPRDGRPEEQPIWLTVVDENPNGANVLILTDGAESSHVGGFEKCLDVFDGSDAEAVAAGRERWRRHQGAGHRLTYWQQDAQGRWEKKA
ncbi:MAG: DNA polymerase III subunit chi [Alphaproteobacteria bacterium]